MEVGPIESQCTNAEIYRKDKSIIEQKEIDIEVH